MKIQSAITQYKLMDISYSSKANKTTKRTNEPFALYNNKGNWLLIAYCRFRNEFRSFRIDFITDAVTQNKGFTPHNMTIKQYFETYVKKS